ncbi:shikimate kinase [Hwangdonia lutea]|uniref:Shikimate kinase n=1 Tax=Hwangdonia lutea TaxID=3075823 RepID=A0AA97ELB7_9FLAO|nr:shikimate kinase [Hwangdonia sp. SCSIO 19198]WOD43599.1 shikimate kinase [Hwangdonia sp. SCSIO 19198]
MIVVLIGYMASGKSTFGRILAEKLNYDFIDLDDYIEEKENTSISDMFTLKGEIYFRKKETQYLTHILQNKKKLILSLGGGTPCYSINMETVLNSKDVVSIYLKATIPTLVSRLKNEKAKRPLIAHIKTDDLLAEFIGKHLFERAPFYNQADKVILTDNKSEIEIIEDILLQLF